MDGECNGCDGLLQLAVCGQGGGCNGFDDFFGFNCVSAGLWM
jgi:hypothetical protein